jgi:cyclopropane fatty-acyl-phospholipid synthase-like methyltransferase
MKSIAGAKPAHDEVDRLESRPHLVQAADWDHFAHEDAYTYIMTELQPGDREAFWRAGETVVEGELLPVMRELRVTRGTALEIGCGVGRLMLPLSRHFQQVLGVDISCEMVRQGQAVAAQRGARNLRFLSASHPSRISAELPEFEGKVDLIYSLLVFQHIADFAVIEAYLRRIGSLLSRDGIAYLQFDTRPQTMLYRMRGALPDFVLPRFWRRGIRRIRRIPIELEGSFARSALEVVQSLTPNTEYHRYILRRRAFENPARSERAR